MFEQSRSVYVRVGCRKDRVPAPDFELLLEVAAYGSEFDVQPALAKLKAVCEQTGFSEPAPTLELMTRHLARSLFAMPGPWAYLLVAESEHLSSVAYPGREEVDMRVKVLNLELRLRRSIAADSGLALDRGEVWAAVRAVAADFADPHVESENAWAERLFAALQIKVKGLHQLTIDLGRQRTLRVHINASGLFPH